MRYLESVDNSLRLLQLVASTARVGVSEAATHLGVAPSTAHRLLATLRFRGFVVQGRDRTYRAGPAMEEMVNRRMARATLAGVVMPALQTLRDNTDESSHFLVLVGRQVRIIASVECSQTLRVGDRTGVMLPAHRSAGGRVLLGALSPQELDELYPPEGLPGSGLDPAGMAALRRDLARCRKQGFAVNNGQTERGITVIGTLVADEEEPIGALSLSMPSVRYQRQDLPDQLAQLRQAANDVLARLKLQVRHGSTPLSARSSGGS